RDPVRLDAGAWDPCCPACGGPLVPEPVPESAPADPRSVYAATKLHQEHLCFAFGREHRTAVTALRYHNVYGPRMPRDTPYGGVAPSLAAGRAPGRAPGGHEGAQPRRVSAPGRDVARANALALTADPVPTGPLNIASGATHTVLELAHALTAAAPPGAPAPAVVGGYRVGDVRHVFADPQRARGRLGVAATVPFDAGIREFASARLRAAAPQ